MKNSDLQKISPYELKQTIQEEDVLIIDVREPAEFNETRIEGSVNVPLSEICATHEHLAPEVNKKIVIHCKSGYRSSLACKKLIAEGFRNKVCMLEGGIDQWELVGLPILRSKSNVISIEKQMHLIFAILIFLSLYLGNFVNPLFFVIQLAMVAGWLASVFLNLCFLKLLLLKMPWNKPGSGAAL